LCIVAVAGIVINPIIVAIIEQANAINTLGDSGGLEDREWIEAVVILGLACGVVGITTA